MAASLFLYHALSYHMLWSTGSAAWSPADLNWFEHLLRPGSVAVTFFFVLSGFTLTYNYAGRMSRLDGRRISHFFVNRFASIWPIHLLALSGSAVFFANDFVSHPLHVATMGITTIALMQAWLPFAGPDTWTIEGFNGPAWTLSALAFYYLLFPLLIPFINYLGAKKSRALVAIPLAWTAAVGTLAVVWGNDRYASWIFHTFPPMRLGDFVTGMCAGMLFLCVTRSDTRTAGGTARWTAFETASLAVVLAVIAASRWLPAALLDSPAYMVPVGIAVYVFAFERGMLSRIMQSTAFVYAGRIAFAFLMLHVVVLEAVEASGVYGSTVWGGHALALTISLVAAIAAHHLWETPARRWIRNRAGARVDACADDMDRTRSEAEHGVLADPVSEQAA